jgi:hypothetical protein
LRLNIQYFSAFIFLLFLSACNQSVEKKKISQGYVLYDVDVVDKNHWMVNLAPKQLKLYFAKGKFAAEMSAIGGIFRYVLILDSISETQIQLTKVFQDKMYTIQTREEITKALANRYMVKSLGTKEDNLGYLCTGNLVTEKISGDTSTIWLTEEMGVQFPVFVMPKNDLKGFPLEYTVENFGLKLRLKAIKVVEINVNESIFQIPKGFNKVSNDSLVNYFKNIKYDVN